MAVPDKLVYKMVRVRGIVMEGLLEVLNREIIPFLREMRDQYNAHEHAAGGGHIIEDEGVPLPQQTNLNFTGDGVTAADLAGKTVVEIPGISYKTVQDEGVDLPQQDTLNFIGDGVTAADVAGVTVVDIPGPTIEVQEIFLLDRFVGGNQSATGNNTNANIGELQWNTARATADGTVARVASTAGHMGIVRLTGHASTGMHQAIYLGHSATSGSVVAIDEVEYLEYLVRHDGPGRFRVGLGDDAGTTGFGANSIGVTGDLDASADWIAFAKSGGATTSYATGIPITTDWITWRIELVSSSEVNFYADDVLVATATTGLPSFSTLMSPAVQVVTFTPGPFQGIGEIDTFKLLLK